MVVGSSLITYLLIVSLMNGQLVMHIHFIHILVVRCSFRFLKTLWHILRSMGSSMGSIWSVSICQGRCQDSQECIKWSSLWHFRAQVVHKDIKIEENMLFFLKNSLRFSYRSKQVNYTTWFLINQMYVKLGKLWWDPILVIAKLASYSKGIHAMVKGSQHTQLPLVTKVERYHTPRLACGSDFVLIFTLDVRADSSLVRTIWVVT